MKNQVDTDLHDLPSLKKLLPQELVLCNLRGNKASTWVENTGLNPNCLQVGQDQRKVQGKRGKQSFMKERSSLKHSLHRILRLFIGFPSLYFYPFWHGATAFSWQSGVHYPTFDFCLQENAPFLPHFPSGTPAPAEHGHTRLPLSFCVHVMEKMHLITLSGLWCLLGNHLPVSYSPKERGRQSLPDTHPSLYAQKQQKPLVHGLGPEPASEQQKQLPDRGQ